MDGYWSGPMGTWETNETVDIPSDVFPMKMKPGETPYTEDERKVLASLVSDAAQAEELFDIDELDGGDRFPPPKKP